jgi:hypothetical protein
MFIRHHHASYQQEVITMEGLPNVCKNYIQHHNEPVRLQACPRHPMRLTLHPPSIPQTHPLSPRVARKPTLQTFLET